MIVTSVLASRLAARFGAGRTVLGTAVVYLGQGPVMALSTDLIVGAAPQEKAGSAAVSETGTEFGLALGVAVIGTMAAATSFGTVAAVVSVLLVPLARLT